MRSLREMHRTFRWAATVAALVALPATAAIVRAGDVKDGRAALQAGRYDDAIKSFERAVSQGSVEGQVGIGQVWLRRRQYDKAREAFLKAQKMDPSVAWGFYGEGEAI